MPPKETRIFRYTSTAAVECEVSLINLYKMHVLFQLATCRLSPSFLDQGGGESTCNYNAIEDAFPLTLFNSPKF